MNNVSRFLSMIFVTFLSCMLSFAGLASDEHNTERHESEAKKVVIFSATYCPDCLHAKEYLKSQEIPFMEFDIEKSNAAREYFDKLGGRGTPFLLVNNRPMQGFNTRDFWRYYGM